MNINEFMESLSQNKPPVDLSAYLRSLWLDAKNDWEGTHTVIQDMEDKTGAWIHAYLHRKEGDNGNARYWYNRAGKEMPKLSLDEEWKKIVIALLDTK